jgi:hypothetical protein
MALCLCIDHIAGWSVPSFFTLLPRKTLEIAIYLFFYFIVSSLQFRLVFMEMLDHGVGLNKNMDYGAFSCCIFGCSLVKLFCS